MRRPEVVTLTGAKPREAVQQLAAGFGPQLRSSLQIYASLFRNCGLSQSDVERVANGSRKALDEWAPDLAAEIERTAELVGVDPLVLHALNARTEVLASSGVAHRGECSTIAHFDGDRVISAQTWDWHDELSHSWHLVRRQDGPLPFVTLTEHGMVGKIGMNAAGVGLHFNILGHVRDTGHDGVPVHAVARRVLDTAVDAHTAYQIIADAPLSASSCFTVVDPDTALCVEATSGGAELVPTRGGWLAHTNHFIAPAFARGDARVGPEPDTVERLDLLHERLDVMHGQAVQISDLDALLCAHEATEGAPICCHPNEDATLGDRWRTLATVSLEPATRQMKVAAGGPCETGDQSWTQVDPPIPT